MGPLVDLPVDLTRRHSLGALEDHVPGAAPVEIPGDSVHVERLVGDQAIEVTAFDQGRRADRVMALAGRQLETDHVAQRIGQGHDLVRHTAPGAADGLAFSPPFAPWPTIGEMRWTAPSFP